MTSFAANDRTYIRDLAHQVAAIAASDDNARILRRWCDVNALRKPDRFPVWCRPVAAWGELLPKDSLKCADNALRNIEYGFRQILIKHEIADDSPVLPYYEVPAVFDCDPPNIWGVDITRHTTGRAGDAWTYDPPIKDWSDLAKLRSPTYTLNRAATDDALCQASELLGDILPVSLVARAPHDSTLCTPATDLRGMTQLMMDLIESPDEVHRLMAWLRDAVLAGMDQVQATGLLTPASAWPMLTSDPLGPGPAKMEGHGPGPRPDSRVHPFGKLRAGRTAAPKAGETAEPIPPSHDGGSLPSASGGKCTYANCWALANSQEFDQVSPAMWKEFLLDYQMPILERFGLVAYGCCENLTRKIEGVLSIPNLRVFICSAWTNLDTVIEKVGRKHVIMWRQKASDVVFPHDTETLKRQLDEGLRKLRGHHVQVVLRELQTLAGHPDRLHVWTRLAIEAAEKYA
jgi:hypothetical protein